VAVEKTLPVADISGVAGSVGTWAPYVVERSDDVAAIESDDALVVRAVQSAAARVQVMVLGSG
jgi:hypothetical protein